MLSFIAREVPDVSITNASGERIHLAPKRQKIRVVKVPKIQARNRRWLRTKRELDLTIRELAKRVRRPVATVQEAIRWAEQEEELEEVRIIETHDPEIDPATGLTRAEVLYLIKEYPPHSEFASQPGFHEILGPLLDRINTAAPAPVVGNLFACQVA